MVYNYKTGVIVPFVEKFYKQLIIVVAGLFIASMLSMTLNASATTGTEVVSGDTSAGENQPGWLFNRDLSTSSPYEFNTNEASIGAGSLYAQPIGANASDKFIAENFINTQIDEINSISYDFKIGSGGEEADKVHFYMNVYANFGVSDDDKFYDCRYNVVPTIGSTGSFSTVTFDPTQSYSVATSGSSPYPCPASPVDMDTSSVGSNIRVFALNVGDTSINDVGLDGYLDNVVVNTASNVTTYDFDPDTTAPADLQALFTERPGGDAVADGGATDSLMFTFNLSATGDPDRYQLKYWNDIPGSPFKEASPWNPTDLSGYSSSLGVYEDQFTQGEGKHYFAFSVCDALDNCSEYSVPFEVTYDISAPAKVSGVTIIQNGKDLGCYPYVKNRTITVDWFDSTESDFDHYEYQADADKTAPYDFTTDVNVSVRTGDIRDLDGTYNYRVRAIDTTGIEGEWSDWCGVTLDRESPEVEITSHNTGAVLSGTVNFAGTVTDDNNAKHRFIIRNSDGDVVYNSGNTSDDSAVVNATDSFDSSTLPDGQYRLVLIGVDKARNSGRDRVRVTIDNAVVLSDKDDCKNGGWRLSDSPEFRNQGQCVKHFTSHGHSPYHNPWFRKFIFFLRMFF